MPRPAATAPPVHIRFAGFDLDEANASLRRDGEAVALAPTPFDLLCALARQPGALLAKDVLLDQVWGHQFVTESVLKTAVSDLRLALGDSPREPRIIETVPRRGYRFIAHPVPVAKPAAAPSDDGPAPPRGGAFIGRADALRRVCRAWERAGSGQRAVVWVAGEPGIGKTTLIEQVVAGLPNVAVARGQCVQHHGAGEPYLPVLEALADLCRRDDALPGLLRAFAPTWLLQLPWLGSADERDALRRELAGVGTERMLREMGELLDRVTEQRPLLLITEDLQWSDRATIALIDHVARRRGRAQLMWLASFRVAEVVALEHPLNALRRELRLHGLAEEIVLDSFSEAEVAACVAQRSEALSRDEAFVRRLHERSDGVPLFVEALLSDALERGEAPAGREARLAAVPDKLAAIIDHHIAKLDGAQRALLAAAAVCGVAFRTDTAAMALGRSLADVALACDELVRGQVWLAAVDGDDRATPAAHYRFRHALFRQVAYDRIPAALRVQLHAGVGSALEREQAAGAAVPPAELALHFERARQPVAAVRHYAQAAQAALSMFVPATCGSLADRAAALLAQAPADPQHDAMALTLATLQGIAAFQTLGVGAQARDAFHRAYALLDRVPAHPLRGRLLHGYGYLLALRGEYAQALDVARRAEALAAAAQDRETMLAACFLQAYTRHLEGQGHEAEPWQQRALAVAETLDAGSIDGFAADPQVSLLGMRAVDLVRSGSMQQCRALVRRARARAASLRQPMSRLVCAWHEALVEVRLGAIDRLSALCSEMRSLVDGFSLQQGATACEWFQGYIDAHQGRAREGHRRIREAARRNLDLGMRAGASELLGYAAEALLRAGDPAAAQAELDEALALAHELREGVYLPQLLLLAAAVARAQGQAAAAAERAREAAAVSRRQDSPWYELLALLELCEHHAASDDERESLRQLADRMPEAAGMAPVQRARSLARGPVGP